MPIHTHTIVEDTDYNDCGFRTCTAKDGMTAQAEIFVLWLYVIRIAAYFRWVGKQLEGIIKLLEVFFALLLSVTFEW